MKKVKYYATTDGLCLDRTMFIDVNNNSDIKQIRQAILDDIIKHIYYIFDVLPEEEN